MTEQPQIETLNHTDPLFPFPPHRRRHLKSETFCTLVRIFSHCYGESRQRPSHSTEVVSEEPKQDSGENELWTATEPELRVEPVGQTGVVSETLLIEGDAQSLKDVCIDECLDEDRMEVVGSDHVNKTDEGQFWETAIICGNTLEDKNPCGGNVVSLIGDQEGRCNLLEMCMEEVGNEGQAVVDNPHHNFEVTEDFDMCLDIDILDELPKANEKNAKGSSFVERHVLEEVGNEMQFMKLEKSLSNCGVMNSPLCVTADEEIEEGEISGNIGLYDQSSDLLLEDAVSLDKEKVNEEQISEVTINKEQKGANQEDTMFNKNFGVRNNTCDGVELTVRERNVSVKHNSEMLVFVKSEGAEMERGYNSVLDTGRNNKQATRVNEEFNHTAVPETSGENATQNQGTSSTKKDADDCKKRKRGPMTEKKKAKKRKRERTKRAQTNKQLGVRRLKIQPVLKPKTVTTCRHYLKGRCQEGEKCKFSHDTIPLTKSKPCCHFARHSCMKGDDCPFDHELSKYPCNNYLTKGYCSRGTGCMFSHELESSSSLRCTSSEKQLSFPRKVDSKSGTNATPSCNNTQNVVESILKRAVQTPTGISRLMFGKSSLGSPSKPNQAASSPKTDGGVKVGLPIINNTLDMAQNSDEVRRITAAPESKGINFLSFGKAPMHDCSSEKPSNLSFSRDCGFQKQIFGDFSKDKPAALSSKKDDGLNVGNQTGQSASDMVHNSSEMPKRASAVAPRGINFLSFGKSPLDDFRNMKLTSVPSSGDKNVDSSVPERESTSKHQISSARPWRLLSSSVPSDQSLEQLGNRHGKEIPSSALKALFPNMPNSAQKGHVSNMPDSAHKSLQSMLAFAAKYESKIKMNHPPVSADFSKESSSSS
ncbi:Zinc finger CCCH domain-containing protein [Actinidia chinensis var. chinensis]|uniref:Zinc finger CCCH domain-containing protein n=1 Tax=Actinidia chinensis var. chinensis TaxID=1590841 RepID=A0A2R6Q536_ACTCC|nr:Zinc finger CCCH domain-containing protein [Actinidia chinensis var. chinensis]